MMNKLIVLVFALFLGGNLIAQVEVSGKVIDEKTKEGQVGTPVQVKGSTDGALTDIDGNFTIKINDPLPVVLIIRSLGYVDKEVTITNAQPIVVELTTDAVLMKVVEIKKKRINKKQQQAALSVETMDVLAIKEAPSGNFYESLGNLKGVDVTSASLGFKVVNTRGFNSTSPVRSLQIIDGVDNQSPGLNFSLGNFLGVPDLDVMSVNIVAGASSAFYGPGAFNGVIDMRSKSPWLFPGLSFEQKIGSRGLSQFSLRYADIIENKDGMDRWAYKINIFRMRADDWEAENFDPATDSEDGSANRAGYDAVNRYGDEVYAGGNDYSGSFNYPGLGRVYRKGYNEADVVDYGTENIKTNMGLYYKLSPKTEINYGFNYSTGTTVYQGENRFSLKDIEFNQHKLEIRKDSVFFVRAYRTAENAGNSYDAVLTAFRMSDLAKEENNYYRDYGTYYENFIVPQMISAGMPDNSDNIPNLSEIQANCGCTFDEALILLGEEFAIWETQTSNLQNDWINSNPELMDEFHQEAQDAALNLTTTGSGEQPFFEPGSARYDSLLNVVTSTLTTEGGSRFFDKSSLYHIQGEYQHDFSGIQMTLGGNGRVYKPNSKGTIFDESQLNDLGLFGKGVWELGAYAGGQYKLMDNKITTTGTVRYDKSQNFDGVISPAVSFVYAPNVNQTVRASFSTALRNPTLSDQYLNLDVGRAILIGNINGVDSLATTDSFFESINGQVLNFNKLDIFSIDPIRPERARTFEVGYRGLLWNKVYADVSVYQSWFKDFIGYKIGLDVDYSENPQSLIGVQAFRAAANAKDQVMTQGLNLGLNYYLGNKMVLNGNFSWNRLDLQGSDDPIIPAFNTPEFKYNFGLNARNLTTDFGFFKLENWGYGINYKWIQGYTFEGSPQFSGFVPTYNLLDAQVNYNFEQYKTNLKLGASNLMNNQAFQVYGGPVIGRFFYASITFDLVNRK